MRKKLHDTFIPIKGDGLTLDFNSKMGGLREIDDRLSYGSAKSCYLNWAAGLRIPPVGIEDQCCIDENACYLSHLSGKAIVQLVTMPP